MKKAFTVKTFSLILSLMLGSCSGLPALSSAVKKDTTDVKENIAKLEYIKASGFKEEYVYGESVDYTDTVITAYYDDGSKEELNNEIVFEPAQGTVLKTIGENNVTVTHTGLNAQCEFKVNVNYGILKSIEVVNYKENYYKGELLNFSDLKILGNYSSGLKIDITKDCYLNTQPGTSLDFVGIKTIKVTHNLSGVSTTFDICVSEPTISSIHVDDLCVFKNEYTYGEALNLNGIRIIADRSDGSRKDVTNLCRFEPSDGSILTRHGLNEISVVELDSEKSCSFNVHVGVKTMSISISGQKTSFDNGDGFTKGAAVVLAHKSNGKTENVTDYCAFSINEGTLLTDEGTQTVTVTYGLANLTCNYDITVTTPFVVSIKAYPTKVSYVNGEKFSTDNITVKGTLSNGDEIDVTSNCNFNIENNKKLIIPGNQTVVVKYKETEISDSYTIQVGEVFVTKISVSGQTTIYENGSNFSTQGIVVTASLSNDDYSDVTENCSFSINDGTTLIEPGDHYVIVTHNDSNQTCSYKISVGEVFVSSISIKNQKTSYNCGESFTKDGAVVTGSLSNGNFEDVTSKCTFSISEGYKLNSQGTIKVTVQYSSDITCSYDITVGPAVISSIEASGYIKSYLRGSTFSKENTVITATKTDGNTINVTDGCTFSATNTVWNTVGEQTVEVVHTDSGKKCQYKIEVTESTITYDLKNSSPSPEALIPGDIIACSYVGSSKSYTLPKGKYKLEAWGAQGGNSISVSTNLGGKGGYTSGTISLSSDTKVFLVSGGQGSSVSTGAVAGGFNGGGSGAGERVGYYIGCSGGGGSDIRIGTDDYNHRILVAGGGGGAGVVVNENPNQGIGGAGGGTSGQNGYGSCYRDNTKCQSYGGSQTSGGNSETSHSTRHTTAGTFGEGSYASQSSLCTSGGGGGWYGGGSGVCRGASGGSGYVYTSSTCSNHPYNSSLGSVYYLTDTSNNCGTQSFISPSGGYETGHSGNGYVRITVLSLF